MWISMTSRSKSREIDQAIESLEAKKAELEKIFEARKALEALKK